MLEKARVFRDENTIEIDEYDVFKRIIDKDGGFLKSHWCGDANCESKIQEETKATIRCIPFDQPNEKGQCLVCGKESKQQVVFAKAY